MMAVERWLWIEARRRFLWCALTVSLMSAFGGWTFHHFEASRLELTERDRALLRSDPPTAQEFIAYWQSEGAANVFGVCALVLSLGSLQRRRGVAREVLLALPMTGRDWIRGQRRLVLLLALALGLASHIGLIASVASWHELPDVLPRGALHLGRWIAWVWLVFGVTVWITAQVRRLYVGVILLGLYLGPLLLTGVQLLDVADWPSEGYGIGGLVFAVLIGSFAASQAAAAIDRGLNN